MCRSKLNKFVRREQYPSVTPAEAVADSSVKGEVFHRDGRTERIPPMSTRRRKPKAYDRRMDEALAGMKDYCKIVDDVVVFDQDEQAHVEHVR